MQIWSLNLRHLRALAEITRLGSLSAAAGAVNLTQPALTQALAKLEVQLGQPLFARQPGGMAATPAALVLTPRIDAALAHIASVRVTMAGLRALIALADHASYGAAAAATGLAQPSLHRAVQDLALALRRNLVERRGRGLALTDAGRRTARAFRLARAELAAGLSELAALQGRSSGRIAVGAMPLSRARLLPDAATAFHRRFPTIPISITEGSHAELIEPLRDGELDLLLGALRDPPPGPDVVQTPLFDDQPIILGRREHPLAALALAGQPVTPQHLAAYPWTTAAPGTPLRTQWARMFENAGVPPPPVPIECGSVITIRQILLDSDFLTMLSADQVTVEIEAGWLVKIADAPGLVRTIGITTRADWRPTAQQAAFVAALRENS